MKKAITLLYFTLHLSIVGCAAESQPTVNVVRPQAIAVSAPVPVQQVEDAAIWIHPTDPAKSLLIISSKTRGLEAHRPDGLLLKDYDDGTQYAGVDVVYDMPVDHGSIDLVVGYCQNTKATGLRFWSIDPNKSKLTDITAGDMFPVLDGAEPLGLGVYHSHRSGKQYVFVTSGTGDIEQYLLVNLKGKISATKVRAFSRPGKTKAVVADDRNGVLYVAQEKTGIWKYPAEPDAPSTDPELIIKVNDHGLIPDLGGLAIYTAGNSRGYLLVVSEGPRGTPSTVGVFQRQSPHRYPGDHRPGVVAGRILCPRGYVWHRRH